MKKIGDFLKSWLDDLGKSWLAELWLDDLYVTHCSIYIRFTYLFIDTKFSKKCVGRY